MFMYENFDARQTRDYVWTDEERAAEQAADRARDEAAGRKYIVHPRYINPDAVPYKGMLDDVLPEENVIFAASVNHWVRRTEKGQSGISESFSIGVQIEGQSTLRDGIAALRVAQEQSAEEQDATPRHFFIDGVNLYRDEDGSLVLQFGLGT